MVNQYKTIDYGWLTKPTGDPFADVGGYVIKYLDEQHPEKDILEHIEYMANIYVYKWEGKINDFFLNHPITQPAYKKRQIEETTKYYQSLIEETAPSEYGYCRITSQKTKLFKAGRNNSYLTGSGKFVNFHHTFQPGMMLSKEVIIRMFFVPYGVFYVSGKIVIIQSNDNKINEEFIYKNCLENDNNRGMSSSNSCLKKEHGSSINSLFYFVDDLLTSQIEHRKDLSLTLYHFTNYKDTPKIDIYKLPPNVFSFYIKCQGTWKTDWQPFLMAHYTKSGYKYDAKNEIYDVKKKSKTINFKTQKNRVLENLIRGESLLRLFLAWSKTHKFNIEIVESYQKDVRNMKKETTQKIKELASFLTMNPSEDAIEKSIKALNGFKTHHGIRRFLILKTVVPNYNAGNANPIVTLEEAVDYLFADDVSWKEIRDFLLIAIYQNLHEKNMLIKTDLSDNFDDNEDINK
ncbi:MAG: type I-B CRISPR-associated protein Cas8b1/Cst1 [Bacteroidales bacterium]